MICSGAAHFTLQVSNNTLYKVTWHYQNKRKYYVHFISTIFPLVF